MGLIHPESYARYIKLYAEDCNIGDSGFEKLLSFDWSFLKKIDLSSPTIT